MSSPLLRRLPVVFSLLLLSLAAGGAGIGVLIGRTGALSGPLAALIASGVTVGGLVCAACSWRALHRAFGQIDALTAATLAIAGGNFDQVLAEESQDKLGQLAAAFNAMARHLRQQRERQEKQRVRLEQACLAIVDCFAGPAIVVDRAGAVQAANRAAAAIWGLPNLATGHSTIWRPPDEIVKPLANALQYGQAHLPQDFRQIVSLQVGRQEHAFLPRVMPLFGEQGCPLGAIVVFDDVTRFRLLDEMQRDFIAAVSHESRTPLTSIRLALYVLQQENLGPLNAAQASLLGEACENAERLLAMIEDLINHSLRLQQEHGFDPPRTMTGNQLLEGVAAAVDGLLRSTKTRIELDPQAGVLTVRVRLGQIVDAVLRVLEHSLRLRDQPGRIVIRVEEAERGVTLSIHDCVGDLATATWPDDGMRFTAPAPAKDTSGFLNTVREMVHAQGGEILIDQQPGYGTVFQLQFPLHTASGPGRSELVHQ